MSTSGDTMSTSGDMDIMSTSGNTMSTSGDVQYIGGNHEYIGGYHEYFRGCSLHQGFQWKLKGFYQPPMYQTSPDVLMISPRCTEHTLYTVVLF